MNEYINCCMDALDKGEDFTKFNIHSGKSMMESCRKKYLIEKLECILGEEIVAKPNKEED